MTFGRVPSLPLHAVATNLYPGDGGGGDGDGGDGGGGGGNTAV